MPLLSILMPVYNEEAYLTEIVRRVLAVSLPDGMTREVVIVDDASTDRTPEILASLAATHSEITAFRLERNTGKGGAVRRAVQEMSGDYAIIQDADLEYDPNDYGVLLAPLLAGRADVVYGSRFSPSTPSPTHCSVLYHRKIANKFLTFFSNLVTGLRITDMETCFKAFRSELLKSIPLRSQRFGIEPELTAKVARRGASVCEVPISYHGRRYHEGKKISWRDGIAAIWTILKYAIINDSIQKPDRPLQTQT